MTDGQYVSYLRVPTAKQSHYSLSLEAQRKAVADYLNDGHWQIVTEVVEIESSKQPDRPKLVEALRLCRRHNATLVIAQLMGLRRDAHFLLSLEKAGVDFVATDMPSATRRTVGTMARVADEERRIISMRTKEGLAAAKANGKKLGGNRGNMSGGGTKGHTASLATRQATARSRASDLAPIIEELKASGAVSLRQIAAGLNAKGIKAARGGEWTAFQVQRVMERVAGSVRLQRR
jgi:DNA invertase Pin-like site-specific DNA recombinase